MKIKMKNIGRVAEADIEINGIAVIAGENGTGKSTVGKALYAAFNSMSDSENKIDRMRRNSVERAIRKAYVGSPLDSTSRHRRTAGRMNSFIDRVFSGECTRDELIDEIKEYYGEEISREIESDFTNGVAGVADQIIEIMDISDDEVFRAIATNRFRSEFNGQINSVFGEEPGKVELQIKDASTVFSVASDEVAEVLDKTGRSKEDKELLAQIENRLSTIARLGRAFGIHLILATQRPDANIIPGQIKNNMDFRVCGRADSVLSQIILDNTSAAEQIPKDARGRFITGDGTVFQGYLFNEEQL